MKRTTVCGLVLLLLALVVGTAPVAPAVAATAVAHPNRSYIPEYEQATQRRYKPTGFTLSGDPSWFVRKATWSTWTHSRAVGAGTYYGATTNGKGYYVPAYGFHYNRWAVKITFTKPKKTCGHYVFTHVKFTFPKHPKANWSTTIHFNGYGGSICG